MQYMQVSKFKQQQSIRQNMFGVLTMKYQVRQIKCQVVTTLMKVKKQVSGQRPCKYMYARHADIPQTKQNLSQVRQNGAVLDTFLYSLLWRLRLFRSRDYWSLRVPYRPLTVSQISMPSLSSVSIAFSSDLYSDTCAMPSRMCSLKSNLSKKSTPNSSSGYVRLAFETFT